MEVIVNVAQVFIGTGKNAKRYRRGEVVEVEGKVCPKWGITKAEAKKVEKKEEPEPTTMSEINAKRHKGPRKAFGQDVD